MKRLCFATDSREPSGVGEHMLALAEALRTRFEIVLACSGDPGGSTLLRRASERAIGIRELDHAAGASVRWLAQGNFDLLHVHAGIGWEGHDLAAEGRAAGIGRIVRTEHLPDVITVAHQRLEHAAGLRHVDRVICVSESAAASFRAAGVEAGKLAVIRNGLPLQPPGPGRDAVRQALRIGREQPTLLSVARFTPQKNHALLLDAARRVFASVPDALLLLAGSGPLEAALQTEAQSLGLGGAVRFLGRRDDVPDLMAAADLFILPSRFEGLPLVVLEAMRAGLPVVASRVGGTDEAVVDRETGRLVESDDPDALAQAIADLLGDRSAIRAYGAAGQARFLAMFTAERMARETMALYASLGLQPADATGW